MLLYEAALFGKLGLGSPYPEREKSRPITGGDTVVLLDPKPYGGQTPDCRHTQRSRSFEGDVLQRICPNILGLFQRGTCRPLVEAFRIQSFSPPCKSSTQKTGTLSCRAYTPML